MTKPKCNVQGPCAARDEEDRCVCLKETSNPCSFQKANMKVTNGHVYPYIKPATEFVDPPAEIRQMSENEFLEYYDSVRKQVGEQLKKGSR